MLFRIGWKSLRGDKHSSLLKQVSYVTGNTALVHERGPWKLGVQCTQCTRTFVCARNTNTIAVYRIYQGTLTEAEGSVQFTPLR